MKNYIGFIDETGVLYKEPEQRFFGLGFLKLENTAPHFELLHKELSRAKDKLLQKELSKILNKKFCLIAKRKLSKEELSRAKGKLYKFEFKFNKINRSNYTFYHDLIDLYFKCPENNFGAFLIDKENPEIDIDKYFKSTWDAYISYTKLLIKRNMDKNDKIFVLADYLSKPKCSSRYYEIEIKFMRKKGKRIVANCCMLESHSSLYIQMVDILLGAVAYDFKLERINNFKGNNCKKGIVDLIKGKLNVPKLSTDFEVHKPNYFSVWEFHPKKM